MTKHTNYIGNKELKSYTFLNTIKYFTLKNTPMISQESLESPTLIFHGLQNFNIKQSNQISQFTFSCKGRRYIYFNKAILMLYGVKPFVFQEINIPCKVWQKTVLSRSRNSVQGSRNSVKFYTRISFTLHYVFIMFLFHTKWIGSFSAIKVEY